jgi:hypothetical protein
MRRLIAALGRNSAIWRELKPMLSGSDALVIDPETDDLQSVLIELRKDCFERKLVLDFRCPPPFECSGQSLLSDFDRIFSRSQRLMGSAPCETEYIRFSSGSVYGAALDSFFPTESFPLNPGSFYAELHSRLDSAFLSMFQRVAIVRLPNVILGFPKEHHFQSKLLALKEGEELVLSDDGSTVRNYVRASCIAEFLDSATFDTVTSFALDRRCRRVFNLSGGYTLTTVEFADFVCEPRLTRFSIVRGASAPKERFRVLESNYEFRCESKLQNA